jgi:hypothetical protein
MRALEEGGIFIMLIKRVPALRIMSPLPGLG